MNEELQQALTELINKSMELGGDALAFTQEQLPDVIQQLLLWKMTISGIFFVGGLLLFVLSAVLVKKYFAWVPPKLEQEGDSTLSQIVDMAQKAYDSGEEWTRECGFTYLESDAIRYLRRATNQKKAIPPPYLIPFAGVSAVIGTLMTLPNWIWLQIWLAHKVYLLEYAANLAK